MWYSLGMNIETLQLMVKERIGLDLRIVKDISTALVWDSCEENGAYIRLNIGEIKDIKEQHIRRLGGFKNIFLKVVLHEIGHFLHCKSMNFSKEYHIQYHSDRTYFENVADRYATLNYKKVLKALKERQTA